MNAFQKPYHYLITKEEELLIEETLSELSQTYIISFDHNYHIDLKTFETFQHYSEIKILSSINLSHDNQNFKILIINVDYRFMGGKYGDRKYNENQVVGFKTLHQDYGKVLIRNENTLDKILEIFHKIEIDFEEDKQFSDNYFVLSDNEVKTKAFLKNENRNLIHSLPKEENFIIQINQKQLIINNKKPINKNNINQIANFLKNNF